MADPEEKPIIGSAQSIETLEVEGRDSSSNTKSSNGCCSATYTNQLLASIGIFAGLLIFGYASGYTSDAVEEMVAEGRLTPDQVNWFASSLFVGCFTGAVLSAIAGDQCGRKLSLMFASLSAALGWVLVAADINAYCLLVGRILCGVHGGVQIAVGSTYQSEIVDASIRGLMLALGTAMFNLGTLVCFLVQLSVSWRWATTVACVVNGVAMVTLATLSPETPHWYTSRDRQDDAMETLRWLKNGDGATAKAELESIEQQVRASTMAAPSLATVFRQRRYWRPLLLSLLVQLTIPLCGYFAILSFVKQVAESAGISNTAIVSVFIGVSQVLVSVIVSGVVDRLGRRLLLLVGGVLVSLALLLLAINETIHFYTGTNSDALAQSSLAGLLLFFIGFNVCWGTVVNAVMAEILPTSIRGPGSSVSVCITFAVIFVSTQSFRPLENVIHTFGVFYLYTALNSLATVLIGVYLPETAGKSLEEIEKQFS